MVVKGSRKILLVDDVKLFLEMEKTFLNRKGFIIFTASSGKEALEIHRREKVDLILLDLYMPEMDGEEVCRRIRRDGELKKVSIIMVTTSSKEEDIELCRRAGANDYITKPIDPKTLLSKISRLLNIPERRDVRVLVRIGVEGREDQVHFFGNTVDISLGGVLVEVDRPLNIGEDVSLSLVLPQKARLIDLKGRVVRRAKDDGEAYRYGIEFIGLGAKERLALKEFIESRRS